MTAWSASPHFNRAAIVPLADWFAVGVAVSLSWSTSATGVFLALWVAAALLTTNLAALKRELFTAVGALPVLLWCLGAIGLLWADVSWTERLGGLGSFNRLLVVPLLLAHFRRSGRGGWVVCALFVSSAAVLLLSFAMVLTPGPMWRGYVNGVPVHDDIFQGSNFLICGFGALGYAILERRRLDRRITSALLFVGALFLANFAFVTVSRAAVLIVPILAVLLGWRLYGRKGVFGAAIVAVIVGSIALAFSANLRSRMNQTVEEFQQYQATNAGTSIGEHLAFLKESIAIVAAAPVIGHGTGSIPEQFRRISAGQAGVSGEATVNPHDQTFAVAIQLGIVGALLLWAMWIAHFLLFREQGAWAWLGTVVVVENVVSSIFHSHLFDFNNGWLYVFGVGVLGGIVLRRRDAISMEHVASA